MIHRSIASAPMNYEPVRTLADLGALDGDEMAEGYRSAARGDPEPGANRGRAFWHGWRCRMMDCGLIPIDDEHRGLVAEVVADMRAKREALLKAQAALNGEVRP